MPNVGSLIWISLQPILKLLLTAAGGMMLNRAGILTPASSKTISQIIVNFLLPPLLFSKIVVSINADNIGQLGILFIGATIYVICGLLAGFALRPFLRLPHNFRGGFVAATTWGNWGDMPLAVIASVASGPPFKDGDADRGLAYVSVFMIVFYASLFPLGGHKLIENDFKHQPLEDASTEIHALEIISTFVPSAHRNSQSSNHTVVTAALSHSGSIDLADSPLDHSSSAQSPKHLHIPPVRSRLWILRRLLISILTPTNIAILFGIIFALIPTLKALFVPVPNGPRILGPDSQPPLAFLYTTANFISGAAIPLGIILLGSALSTFTLTTLSPLPTITLLLLRLVITPLIAIPLIQFLVARNVIPAEDKMLRFVLMFQGAIPSATSCVYLTQMYSPNGEAKEIASVLVAQYVIGIVVLTGSIYFMLGVLF